jgi:CheY-like chemotaxis protein
MNTLVLWLLVGLGALGLAGWRVAAARRRRAAAAREQAAAPAAEAAPAPQLPVPVPPGMIVVNGRVIPERRSAARLQADRVIAAELARRHAKLPAREALSRAVDERRALPPVPPRDAGPGARAARGDAPETVARMPAPPAIPPAPDAGVPPAAPAPEVVQAPVPAAAPAPSAPVAARRPAAPRVAKTPQQTLVMVVDDSKMVRVKTSRLLESHGFQVLCAVDGQDAIAQLEARLPDLVITDVDMPKLDGFGLARHLRGHAPTAHLPIVMITSAEDRHREEATQAGVGLVLGKPYPEDELIAHIRSFSFFAELQETAEAVA